MKAHTPFHPHARRSAAALGLAAALGATLPATAVAQAAAGPAWRATASTEYSLLDRGLPAWQSQTLRLGRHWQARQWVEVEATHTRRYDQDDTELALAGAVPVGDTLTATARVAHSPTHRVLARDTLAAGLQWAVAPAWLVHAGLRHTRYTDNRVEQATLGVEHYFGAFGATLLAHQSRGLGRSTGAGELRLAWYYADAASVTLFAGSGDEATAVGAGAVALARVRSLALAGRHPLAPGWSLEWGLHRVRQGDFHRRGGATLGVQHTF